MYFTAGLQVWGNSLVLLCRNGRPGFDNPVQAPIGGAAEGDEPMTSTSPSSATGTIIDADAAAAVRALLDAQVAAHASRDAAGILAPFARGAARYDLAPPLQQGPGTLVGDLQGVTAWLATFDGPVLLEHRDLVVDAGGDLALAHALTRMTATPAGAPNSFSFWFRSTWGLPQIDGSCRIVHEHQSTPFHMDGSFRAATDLEP